MESILTSAEAQKIIDFITPTYGEAYAFLWLLQVVGAALDECVTSLDEYFNQVTPQTATWTIGFWESEYGINPDPSWDLEQRRKNVMAKMRYKVPITPKKLEDMVSSIIGHEVKVNENISKNKFQVFVYGYTKDTQKAIKAIEKAKPAHLIYDFIVSDYVKVDMTLSTFAAVSVHERISINVI